MYTAVRIRLSSPWESSGGTALALSGAMLRTIVGLMLASFPSLAGSMEIVSTGRLPFRSLSTVSHDGRFVAYESEGAVLLRDRIAGTVIQASPDGGTPLISADGSAVAFASNADDLVPGQSGPTGYTQLFLFERATGTIRLVSHAAGSATVMSAYSSLGSDYGLSADGRWLVFQSSATDLVPGGTQPNWIPHVYLFDRLTGQNVLVDGLSPGAGNPRISGDGRWIVYESNGLFLYDRIAGVTTEITFSGRMPRINADGRWVAFVSSFKLTQDNSFGGINVYLWDRLTGGLTLVSRSAASPAVPGNSSSHWVPNLWEHKGEPGESVLSADGRWIAFYSSATDLVPGPPETDEDPDLFLFDRVTGTTVRVTPGLPWDGYNDPGGYAMSADGSRIAFTHKEDEVVPGQIDFYSTPDLFLYDRATGTTELVSREAGTTATAGGSTVFNPYLSADGRTVVFHGGPELHEDAEEDSYPVYAYAVPDPGRDFHTVVPCRLLDTRLNGPALASGEIRRLKVTGSCGIPPTARAVAVNATVLQGSGAGRVGLHPGDMPSADGTISFQTGQVRSNNAMLALAYDGTGTLAATPTVAGGGTVHLILDVSGWFE